MPGLFLCFKEIFGIWPCRKAIWTKKSEMLLFYGIMLLLFLFYFHTFLSNSGWWHRLQYATYLRPEWITLGMTIRVCTIEYNSPWMVQVNWGWYRFPWAQVSWTSRALCMESIPVAVDKNEVRKVHWLLIHKKSISGWNKLFVDSSSSHSRFQKFWWLQDIPSWYPVKYI